MKKKNKQLDFFTKLEEKLNELFPKGHKHRGEALVLNAWANIFHEEILKQKLEE